MPEMLTPLVSCEHCYRRPWVVIFKGLKCCRSCYKARLESIQYERLMSKEPSFEHEVTKDDVNRSF